MCAALNAPGKIVLYFAAVLILGALLAPPLYWAAQAMKPHAEAKGWIHYEINKDGTCEAEGPAAFLDSDFTKVSNRAALIVGVILLMPLFRSLRIHSVAELGLRHNPHRARDFLAGFCISVTVMALLAALLLKLGVYRMKDEPPWADLLSILLSGIVVGILEEWVFRAAFLGTFRRTMRPWTALLAVSALFSILHFLRGPEGSIPAGQVGWASGFALLPHRFAGLAEPWLLLGGFLTLFCFGLVCGWAVLRTQGLALAIGFHAGMVLGKFGFNRLTKRPKDMRDLLPWIGEDMTVGIVGIAVVLTVGALFWCYIRWFRSQTPLA